MNTFNDQSGETLDSIATELADNIISPITPVVKEKYEFHVKVYVHLLTICNLVLKFHSLELLCIANDVILCTLEFLTADVSGHAFFEAG